MRHLKSGRKLSRTSSHRKALFRNLAASLFYHESIKTTNPKALELRRVAERLITMAKSGGTHAMRHAFAILRDKGVVKKLFADIGARYDGVNGGYTRVLKLGPRKGDAAPMALIELTRKKEEKDQKKEAKKASKKAAPKKETEKQEKAKAPKKEKAEAEKGKKEEKKAPKKEKKAKEEKAENAETKKPARAAGKKQVKQEQAD